jgi:hypothetical protein
MSLKIGTDLAKRTRTQIEDLHAVRTSLHEEL